MDVREIELPSSTQSKETEVFERLYTRIIRNARCLRGSNKFLDVVNYRYNDSATPTYAAVLIEHTGPHDAEVVLFARADSRNAAYWLLLDITERELETTFSGAVHGQAVNTRRLVVPKQL